MIDEREAQDIMETFKDDLGVLRLRQLILSVLAEFKTSSFNMNLLPEEMRQYKHVNINNNNPLL